MSAARCPASGESPSGSAGWRATATLGVTVEALVVGAYGAYLGVENVVAPATERVAAVVMAAFAVALAVVLVIMARALSAGRAWPVSPIAVWQALQVSIAVPALRTRWPVGVGLMALSVVVAVGLLVCAWSSRTISAAPDAAAPE